MDDRFRLLMRRSRHGGLFVSGCGCVAKSFVLWIMVVEGVLLLTSFVEWLLCLELVLRSMLCRALAGSDSKCFSAMRL